MLEGWANTAPLREHVRDGFFLRARCSHFGIKSSDQRRAEFAVDALRRVFVRALLTELLSNVIEDSAESTLEHGSMAVASLN
jgi:hypothetical protein